MVSAWINASALPQPFRGGAFCPQLVQLAEHDWCAQATLGQRQHPVKSVAGQHGGDKLFAAAGSEGSATVQRERNVTPERAAKASRSGREKSSFHKALSATKAAAASALPPAIPPATGMPFSMTISTFGATPPSTASISRHATRGWCDRSARPRRRRRSPARSRCPQRHREGVCQRQCLKNRRQLVIAVVSQVPDGKVEIHLGRGGPDDYGGAWNDGEHKEQQ